MTDPNDVILWPCGTWCYREDLPGFTHKSDDYEQIPAGSMRARDIALDPYIDGVVPVQMTEDEREFFGPLNSQDGNESIPTTTPLPGVAP